MANPKYLEVSPLPRRPIDPSLFKPTDEEWKFLRTAISHDDDEVRRKVLEIQKETYDVYPYPCILYYHFTNLMMVANPIYNSVINAAKVQQDIIFLDLGCCMGTDVRKLVIDGYPASNIVACDLRQAFIETGFKLYRDRDFCQIKFITGDIFDLSTEPIANPTSAGIRHVQNLDQLKGRLTHIYAGGLFHLFTEESQFAIAIRLACLLKTEPGAIIFGRHVGSAEASLVEAGAGRFRYEHSPASWGAMWKNVFTQIKDERFATSQVVVNAELMPFESGEGRRPWLFWSVCIR